jgi:hypothetical protein
MGLKRFRLRDSDQGKLLEFSGEIELDESYFGDVCQSPLMTISK